MVSSSYLSCEELLLPLTQAVDLLLKLCNPLILLLSRELTPLAACVALLVVGEAGRRRQLEFTLDDRRLEVSEPCLDLLEQG